jgi:Zn-dependent protease with chaperone function
VAGAEFDFFEQQKQARRTARLLVLWYVAAAVSVVASYCFVAAVLYALLALYGAVPLAGGEALHWHGLLATYADALLRVPGRFLAGVAVLISGIALAATLHRGWALFEGGRAVAGLLGARRLDSRKASLPEQRLLNVVQEMAIASGIRVPPVYVLERERAVNALVAGKSSDTAVIVVTRGALDALSRDEMQGIMGHEFSHILNGDMSLNIRVVCLLAGLTWLVSAGEAMVYRAASASRGEEEGSGPAVLLAFVGALISFVGFPGALAASAIRAAISRERELLADSASVQFTRNPDALAGALDSIAFLHSPTSLLSAHGTALSHMFFAPVAAEWWGFASHPPLEERIRRINPRFQRDVYRVRRHGLQDEVAVLDGLGDVVKHVKTTPAPTASNVLSKP